jgi:serine/threonine protein phosphatase 1
VRAYPAVDSVSVVVPAAVIGDVHGRADLLRALLERLPPDMPVFVMGDLCDRGPDTRAVIDLLVARGARGVVGNHDLWLRDWALGEGFDPFALHPAMGGAATLAAYGVAARSPGAVEAEAWRVPRAHGEWLATLPVALDLEVMGQRYWLVHGGVPASSSLAGLTAGEVVPHLARTSPASLLWAKTEPHDVLPVDRTVVMGHVPLRRPVDTGAVLAIDTGCGTLPGGGRLTAVILPERRFLTV